MILTDVGLVARKSNILRIKDSILRDKEIALWACELIEGFFFIAPPPIPEQVQAYYNFAPDVRKKMNQNDKDYTNFWSNPIVKNYFDEKQRIENTNQAHLQFLLWCRELLKEEPQVIDIDQALTTHKTTKIGQKVQQPSWTE